MRWFHPCVWPAFVALCSFLVANAQSNSYLRAKTIETYVDATGGMSFDEIKNKIFKENGGGRISTGATTWLKFPVPEQVQSWKQEAVLFTGSNETALSMHGYLVHGSTYDDLGLCDVRLDSTDCRVASLQYAFSLKAIEGAADQYVLLKVEVGEGFINNEFYFMKRTYFNKVTIFLDQFVGFGLGIFFLIAVMSFVYYAAFSEKSFLVYGLFYLSVLLYLIVSRGDWDAIRVSGLSVNGATVLIPILLLTVFFDILFIKVFFDMREKNRRLNALILVFLGIIAVAVFFSLFGATRPYALLMTSPIVIFAMLSVAGILIYFVYQNRKWAGSVATAWGIVIVCNMIWILYRDDRIEGFWLFGYYSILGRAIEAAVLNVVIFQKLQSFTVRLGFAQAKSEESVVVKALLRTLSHDLASTTMVIRESAQFARGTSEPATLQKNIDRIFRAADSQAAIIKNARRNYLVRGGDVIKLGPVDLSESLREAIETFRERAKEKQIDLSLSLPEEPLIVIAEKTSLRHQVIANLTSNALKFTKAGKKIVLSGRIVDETLIELKVSDEGIGMPAHILDRLFSESETVTRRGTDGELGSGDGLLIVRDFLSTYGAKIQIESRINRGTQVTVFFNTAAHNAPSTSNIS